MSVPHRGEQGFTLVELLVTVLILSVVMGSLSAAIIVGLRTTDETAQRLSDSHDLQLLSVYLPADVQSAVEGRIDTTGATATGCASTPLVSSNLIRFQWEEPGTARQFSAGYRVEAAGSETVLVRYSCIDAAAPRRLVVVHGLAAGAQPTPEVSGRSITVRLTLASGLTTSVTAVRRTPGSVPPELVVAFPVNAGEYNDAGWAAGCASAGICGTASDAVGLQSVDLSILQVATGRYWDGSSFAATAVTYNNATGLASWAYSFPAASFAAEGAYAVTIRAVNALGTAVSATRTFVLDRTAPTTTDNTAALDGGWKNTEQTVTLAPIDSGGAGVAATYFTTDGSAPTTASSPGTTVALSAEGAFTVKYFSIDGAGNREAVKSSGTPIRIDRTPPSSVALTDIPTHGHIRNGHALKATATDALSGVASVGFWYCAGASCTPNQSVGSQSGAPASVVWTGQPADGVYRLLARAHDHAGNTVDSAVRAVTVDNTAPAVDPALVQAANGSSGNKAGTAEQGDTVALGFSEALRAPSICSTWLDDATTVQTLSATDQVVVTITDVGANDVLSLSVTGVCGEAVNIGSISLGRDYVATTAKFSGAANGGKSSTLTWDPAAERLVVRLGQLQSGTVKSGQTAAAVTYTPSAAMTDLAGNALAATPVTGGTAASL